MDKDIRLVLAIKKLKESFDELSINNETNRAEIDNINKQIDELIEKMNNYIKEAESSSEGLKNTFKDDIKKIEERIEKIKLTPGPKGADGKDGRDGERGERGLPGKDGRDGKDGINGKDGKDGIGINGRDGIDGQDGKDGISIIDANIDKNGHLIIKFSDGEKKDVGNVLGANGVSVRGPQGVSVKEVEIRNNHLYVKLSNGVEIDAGVISGGGSGGEETDPIFTNSPAYNITNQDISNWNNKSDFSGSYDDLEDKPELFSGDYNDLDNKPTIPTIPTNVSAFTNDAGYLTEHQSLNGYATEQWVENKNYLTQHQDISGKYDKTGGEISGNVKVDGSITWDIEDEDYDAGIRTYGELTNNEGPVLNFIGYANGEEPTNYKPVIRNVGTPTNDYDVANKKYVDDNVVVPTFHLVFLNADGTIDTYASTVNYTNIKNNLTNPKEADYLDILWWNTRFYAKCIEVTDVNTGDLKFIGEVEYQGIQRYMVFTLNSSNVLTTTNIITFESVSNKAQSVVSNSTSTNKYPSTKAVYDEFQRKPVVVWESNDTTTYLKGIQANLSASPSWQLTDLDLTPYKRIKIYSCAGQKSGTTASASTTPAIVLEMSLDSRNSISAYGGNYVGSTMVQKPNDANRFATLTCAVSADKTKFVVLRQSNIYGTAVTGNDDVNANVFMIEGYYD